MAELRGGTTISGYLALHKGNPNELLDALKIVDGAGSGLDADTIDGIESTSLLKTTGGTLTGDLTTVNILPTTDSTYNIGSDANRFANIYTDNVTGSLTGNASTASSAAKLTTARTIALTGDVTGSVSFDGTNNVSITATVTDDSHNHIISNVDGLQDALDLKSPLASPTFTGTPLVPTATLGTNTQQTASTEFVQNAINNIASNGVANSANKLATARNINGVAFDGTADITVYDSTKLPLTGGSLTGDLAFPVTNQDRFITFSESATGFDWRLGYLGTGSGDANYLVFQSSQDTGTYVNALRFGTLTLDALFAGNVTAPSFIGSLTGNANTATKLYTPRTISLTGDVTGSGSFDGSGDLSITATVVDDSHNHIISNVDGLQTALDAKSPLASPTFTGTATAPTFSGALTGNASTATKLATARTINGVSFDGTSNITINAVDSTSRIATSLMGVANGVATLGNDGLVPASQLPSYVDDALEYADYASLPATGETGKIYVALDTNKIYRWSGSTYIEISADASTADAATKLATARTISLTGDVTGSVSFDGTSNVSITATVTDDSHNHVISNVDGLQTALDAKSPIASPTFTGTVTAPTFSGALIGNASTANSASKLTTARTIALTGDVTGSGSFDGSDNLSFVATVADDSHSHIISNVDGLQTALDAKAPITSPTFTGTATAPTFSGALTGNASTATKLATARTIALTGDVTGSVSFDGTSDVSITAAIVDDSHNHIISNVDGLQSALDLKAPIASPTFTGTATAPTFSGALTGNASTATKLATARTINGISFDGSANITINAVDSTSRIATALIGVANGVASLDSSGLVPASQLPSYVDDVLEYADYTSLPTTGETGKIYVDLETNKIYRWNTSSYTEIGPVNGVSDSAIKLSTARTISLTGDVTGSGSFDGSADLSITATITDDSHNHIISNVDGLQTALDAKAPLSNPTFTGTVTATTFAGNASTATKLATARTLSLTGDVTGSATFDGSDNTSIIATVADNSHNHDKTTIDSVYADKISDVDYSIQTTPLSNIGIFDILRGDRTAFLPADQIIIEQSIDGGVTWTDAGVSDTIKRQLFTGQRPNISIPLKNGVQSTDCMLRVTITGMKYNVPEGTIETEKYNYWNSNYVLSTERYTSIERGWVWLCGYANSIQLTIETAKGLSATTWTSRRIAYMSGWSGGNYFNISRAFNGCFGGGTNQTNNEWNWRFTFRTCSPTHTFVDADLSTSYNTSNQVINHIKTQGSYISSFSINTNRYMYNEHLYNWDEYKNVTFPANLTATSFIGPVTGNASTATKLATARTVSLTGSVTGTGSFDGSGDLSIITTTNHTHPYASAAFLTIWVDGQDPVIADTINDTLDIRAGTNISITTDPSIDQITINSTHPVITAASSVNNSSRTYIQDITLDSNGHVTGLVSDSESDQNTFTNIHALNSSGVDITNSPYTASTSTSSLNIKAGTGITLSMDTSGIITIGGVNQYTHPTYTSRVISLDTAGIEVLDTLAITSDSTGHISAASGSKRSLPSATSSVTGVLTSADWTTFNSKINSTSGTTSGYIPTWGADGKTLNTGYSIETALTGSSSSIARADAVKTYIDNVISVADALVYKGVIDCSANPNYPAGDKGFVYKVSVAGKIGGASGVTVEAGDMIICNTDSTATGDYATVGSKWDIIQNNIDTSSLQPKDNDLTAIAALAGTGYAVRTASDTWTNRTITSGTGITVTNGDGISGNTTIAHTDTSSQSSISNSGRTYIQSVTLDGMGHVTALTSASETTDPNTTYSIKASSQTDGAGLDLDAGGSGSGTDTVIFKGGSNVTVSYTDANTITIASTDTNTDTLVTQTPTTTNATYSLLFADNADETGTVTDTTRYSTGVKVNPSTNNISATSFTGDVTGNVIGNVTGNVSGSAGSCTGNSATATKLATARTISLTGDVTGSSSFDGSGNLAITAAVTDDSHNHIISNVDGLQTALDAKSPIASPTFTGTVTGTFSGALTGNVTGNVSGSAGSCTGNSATATKLATARTISLTGDVTGSSSFDGSGNLAITAAVTDDSHNHIISNVDGLQTALDAKSPIASPTFTGTVTAPSVTLTSTSGIKTIVSGQGTYFRDINIKNNTTIPTGYIKFVTPIRTSQNQMFSIDIEGYDYNLGKTIDFTVCGYAYATNDKIENIGFSNRSSFARQVRVVLEDVGTLGYRRMVIALGSDDGAGTSDQAWYFQKFSASVRLWGGAYDTINATDFYWLNETTLASGYWQSSNINNQTLDGQLGTIYTSGHVSCNNLILGQTTGTAPMTVSSTTVVTNLNADKLDGNDASAFALSGHTHGNITNVGAIGSTSGLMVKTGASGVLTALAAGSSGQYLQYDGTWSTPPDTNTNYYPTTFAWSNGTTSGPTGSLTGSGMSAVSFGAIPSASGTVSGIITTGVQTIAGVKTFSDGITGSLTGNAATATKLATARTISLTGDVTGSVAFDGSGDASITAVVVDDSHNHVISNVDGLQTALDAKAPIASPTFTGTATAPTFSGALSGNASTATKLATARTINGVSFDGSANITINAVDSTSRIASSLIGVANGVASLDSSGLVPASQLPSFVDDALEYTALANFPTTGETGKIYVALDTNKIYRWTGSVYVEISANASTADAATKLATARTVSLTGDVTGSGSFDGSADLSITTTIADDSHNHIISNVDGLQTALDAKAPIASPTFTGTVTAPTFSGALTGNVTGNVSGSAGSCTGNAATATKLASSRTISLTGDVTGSGSFDGSGDLSITATVTDDSHKHIELVPFVSGTQTSSTNAFTGNASTISALYDGLSIRYWLPYAGTGSGDTLNLTLSDSSTTGAKTIYWKGTSVLTTHYGAGSVILLTYRENVSIAGSGSYTGWWCDSNYYTDTYDRIYWGNVITAGAAIYSYKLLMQGNDGKFYPLTLETGTGTTKTISTQEFTINTPILYYGTTTTISANGTLSNVYSETSFNTGLSYTANQTSWTSQLPIYLKGTILANGNFKLDNTSYTSFMTQTLPTTEDGFVYILLGYMSSTTAMRLMQYHPMYEYKDGCLREYIPAHKHGNITNAGAIGSTSGLMIKTGTDGVLETLAAGSSGQYLQYDGTWSTPPDTNTNYYPTAFAWSDGAILGPTGSLTGSGMSAVSFGAIPSASDTVSGIINTTTQTIAGYKTFSTGIAVNGTLTTGNDILPDDNGNQSLGNSSYKWYKVTSSNFEGNNLTSTGALTLNSTTTNALTIDSTTTGAINIGTNANAKTITIGNSTGATGLVLNTGSGNITVGGSIISDTDNTDSLGSATKKFANVYATTFTGALSGNASTATKATQDGSGNTITSYYSPTTHAHGNLTSAGAIGSTSGLLVKTGASGVLTTLAAGTSGQYLQYDGTWSTPAGSTDTNYYPTTFTWSNGTTSGPTASITGNSGFSTISVNAIPAASGTASGIVTTDTQTIAGLKTFNNLITASSSLTFGASSGLMVKTGTNGTLTALASGTTSQFLRGDGTWSALTTPISKTVTATASQTDFVYTTDDGWTDDLLGILVFRSGIYMTPSTDYTVSSKTITFTVACEAGEIITVIFNNAGAVSTTYTPADATTSVKGVVELADITETTAGTSSLLGVTPVGLKTVTDTMETTITNNYTSYVQTFSYPYVVCDTASATAAKTANLTDFILFTGARLSIKFNNANTASSPTLNINSTGAKSIYINGSVATNFDAIVYEIFYDGTNWVVQNSNVFLKETYTSGSNWYRIWSNGWVEQGCNSVSSTYNTDNTVTLLVPYASTNYNVLFTQTSVGSTSTSYFGACKVMSKSTTSFVWRNAQSELPTFNWYSCGQS